MKSFTSIFDMLRTIKLQILSMDSLHLEHETRTGVIVANFGVIDNNELNKTFRKTRQEHLRLSPLEKDNIAHMIVQLFDILEQLTVWQQALHTLARPHYLYHCHEFCSELSATGILLDCDYVDVEQSRSEHISTTKRLQEKSLETKSKQPLLFCVTAAGASQLNAHLQLVRHWLNKLQSAFFIATEVRKRMKHTSIHQVLVLHYLLHSSGLGNIDKTIKARLAEFLTGRNYHNLYEYFRYPSTTRAGQSRIREMKYVMEFFLSIGMDSIADLIQREIED